IRLQEASGITQEWLNAYFNEWANTIGQSDDPQRLAEMPGYLTPNEALQSGIYTTAEQYDQYITDWVEDNATTFDQYHEEIAQIVNSSDLAAIDPAFVVGTPRFEQKLDEIKSKRFTDGGSLFFDRSRLLHGMGEYRYKPRFAQIILGGSMREYRPNSAGTIFRDTGNVVIRNGEFGIYAGLEKPFLNNKVRTTVTLRMDKNRNFNALFSPAASIVYVPNTDRTFRISFSSAIRNPTLADQYLYYNVGRAILLGNVEGQFETNGDSLFTIESFNEYRRSPGANLLAGSQLLDWFHVDRIRPEQVRTLEIGYRGTHWEKFYFDANAYSSWYTDFIGFILGLSAEFDPSNGFPVGGIQAYRLSANATSMVRTQGASLGLNYFRKRSLFGFNYSYNELITGEDDPIIPAFNTPRNKFNLSITAHDMLIPFTKRPHLGFGVNYRYVESFLFQGSPQFSGQIPSYDMVDVQVNIKFPKANLTAKAGASNLFGILPLFDQSSRDEPWLDRMWKNEVLMVYGGPYIGRLGYVQLIYEFQ
ncbi:MAG: TonB-dependent receptor, partial [Bacteroidota bacterium]|nr:TonB-dependent receptor [Bacteroidota bacterium]